MAFINVICGERERFHTDQIDSDCTRHHLFLIILSFGSSPNRLSLGWLVTGTAVLGDMIFLISLFRVEQATKRI